MKKTLAALLLPLLLLPLLSSCSGGSNTDAKFAAYDMDYAETPAMTSRAYAPAANAEYGYYAEEGEAYYDKSASTSSSKVTDTRKIVYTVSLSLETKEFDAAVAGIRRTVSAQGGYIENSYVSGRSEYSGTMSRSASFTLRVPAATLDDSVGKLCADCNVLSKNENAGDITDVYYDTEARLKSLLTQEERLLKMLETADKLEYMLQLESKLSEVRYQIESYYSTIKRYDSQVSLSTVTIELSEVVEYKPVTEPPKTFGERIGMAITESWKDFADGFEDFTVGFFYAIPSLLVLLVILGVIIVIVLTAARRARRRREEVRQIMERDKAPDSSEPKLK